MNRIPTEIPLNCHLLLATTDISGSFSNEKHHCNETEMSVVRNEKEVCWKNCFAKKFSNDPNGCHHSTKCIIYHFSAFQFQRLHTQNALQCWHYRASFSFAFGLFYYYYWSDSVEKSCVFQLQKSPHSSKCITKHTINCML